jgi:hypothetical protein
MPFPTRSHRLAALCGAVPLSIGTAIFAAWIVARWDWLMFAGVIMLYCGVASVVVGAIALAHGCWTASRRASVTRRRRWTSALGCAGLLFVNLPVAAGIIWAALSIMTRYSVTVRNDSTNRLDNVQVVGGGCDATFATTSAIRSLWIRHDDVLTLHASRGADTIDQVIDPYVTNNGGGHTVVMVQRDDTVAIARTTVRSMALADRIRDSLFWLDRADC